MSGNLDARQIEEELEELEGRLERLRALYEQYFLGLEKLEPQIPRKDVERRFFVLRREQIRNTGMRFRFQMLVQRFNTFQQYWGRTIREIENGTYRRDVIRAAQRIGEKEAMTIVGKRRAEKYARLANQQKDREKAKSEAPPVADPQPMDEADEAPTPARLGPVSARIPAAPLLPFGRALAGAPQKSAEPVDARPDQRQGPNAPPPRESDPDAARRRVAALAAELRSKSASVAKPAADHVDLDLDLSSRPPPARKTQPPPRRGSSGRMKAVRPPESPRAERRSSNSMRAVKEPPAPEPAQPPAGEAALRPVPPPVPAPRPPPPPPRAVPPAAPSRPAVPDPHLSDQRMREIYSKYVETKRGSNESTAGLTYDKLAESLRAQANKLRATHPNRKVDYEVVVKDGKTLLKPVLK